MNIARHHRVLAVAVVLLSVGTTTLLAENWPQWRGPGFDGTSDATGLPTTFGPDDNVRWRMELPGPAASTPVVWGDRIYLTSTREGSDELLVMAVGTGGTLQWERAVGEGSVRIRMAQLSHETSAASPSPVTDGSALWVFFGTGQLMKLDLDGKVAWETNLFERYGEPSLYFGVATSPLLHDGKLYFQWLHEKGQTVLALDAGTGIEAWRHDRTTDARAEALHAYTTPIPGPAGEGQVVLVHGADYLTAHDPSDGREVWRFGTINPADNYGTNYRLVATPTVAENVIVVPTAQRGPVFAIRADVPPGQYDASSDRVLWKLERTNPDVPSPLVHEGIVYLNDVKGVLRAVDLETGTEIYAERVHEKPHRSSPILADGRIYLAGTDGTISVVAPGREYRLLARNELGERLAASPAVAHGTIFLRTYDALWAIGIAASKTGP